jgi:hypothetical protein
MKKEVALHLMLFIKKSIKPNKKDYFLQKQIRIACEKYTSSIKAKDYCIYDRDLFVVKEILKNSNLQTNVKE